VDVVVRITLQSTYIAPEVADTQRLQRIRRESL